MQLGYVVFTALAPERHVVAVACAIVFGAFVLAYVVWRFAEAPAHRWFKVRMTAIAEAIG
jgi:peptidoglycan/LPS O-acetylase OafA/YrhL